MSGVADGHLDALYASTDDPWGFRTSPYEQGRFAAIVAAIGRPRYAHILELGCGNGELARRLAPRTDRYTGLDAVGRALDAARLAVPSGRFVQARLPCAMPEDGGAAYDLILLSEILYFFDEAELATLAGRIDAAAPTAELLAVTWLGPSGNRLEGAEALRIFGDATARGRCHRGGDAKFRIDAFGPVAAR